MDNNTVPGDDAAPASEMNTSNAPANMKPMATKQSTFSIWRHMMFGSVTIGVLLLGIGGWAATAELTGAVIAPGSIVVDQNVKKVQHRDGGIVSQINVKNGDRVDAGDVVLRIDDTQIRAELGVLRSQLTELIARSGRLSAEVNSLDEIVYPEGFTTSSPHATKVALAEGRLFTAARSLKESQKEQLELQILQLEQEITGITAQREAKNSQLELINRELEQIEILFKKNLTSITRLYSLQREAKRLSGEFGGLVAQIARTKGKISEIRLQILSVDESGRLQSQRELRTLEARTAELREREIAAVDRLKRCDLLAPQSGYVHELAVHTVGGVIVSAETVLVIVPDNAKLTVEARIAPVDIDQVTIGREATLRFSAFNQQSTPELKGRVIHISADVSTDKNTSQSFYIARLEVAPSSRDDLEGLKLLPGMPVETFISTGTRTALSYLSKPITDHLNRAFREE